MNRLAIACLALFAVPQVVRADDWQYANESEDEGTYSTYSSQEAVDNAGAAAPGGSTEYAPQAEAQPPDQQQMFNDFWTGLSPYGQWVQQDPYGWVWVPGDPSFAPYTDGRWVYTTDGWTYVSDAPYAWAVFHYGRWAPLERGWGWVPGYEWAPAWVSFRSTPEYVGWCPVGPGGVVYDYWPARRGFGHVRSPWVFVGIGGFGGPIARVAVEPRDAEVVYHRSAPARTVVYTNQVPTFREVPHVHHSAPVAVVHAASPANAGLRRDGVAVYRVDRPVRVGRAPGLRGSPAPASAAGNLGGTPPAMRPIAPPPHPVASIRRPVSPTPHPVAPAPHPVASIPHPASPTPHPVAPAPPVAPTSPGRPELRPRPSIDDRHQPSPSRPQGFTPVQRFGANPVPGAAPGHDRPRSSDPAPQGVRPAAPAQAPAPGGQSHTQRDDNRRRRF